ncbi:unnamed protein product, partial [Arabidopsis halleri]
MALTTTNPKHKFNSNNKTISPYDLTSNDNPGAVISQPLLTGLNYDEWALNFRMALSSRKKFGFLDGSISKPVADAPELEDWTANNHLLVGWIKQTIEPKIRSTISTREVAKDLWDIIKKRFSVKSGARLQQLINSLANCKQNGSTVDEYFGRLTKLWDGISDCMNSKQCSCGKCECDLNTARDREQETLCIHDFLSGLDESTHGVIRSQICAINPLPNLDTVYQTVSQNETIRTNVTSEPAVMGFAAHMSGSNSSPRSTLVFTHDVTKRNTSFNGPSRHIDSRPPQNFSNGRGRGNSPRANLTQILNANSATTGPTKITDNNRQGLLGLTDDQWMLVEKVLNTGKTTMQLSGKNANDVWILDTGATHHMTGQIDLLTDTRDIAPVLVSLAAGDAIATKQGTIKLTPQLSLYNVYLVPGFHINLISFGQLVTENFLVGQVTDKILLLQDRITRTLIGLGEREREGLYRFRGIETATALQTRVADDLVLWHHRLGHPSSRVTRMIPVFRGVSNTSSEHLFKSCDVCLRSKQTRQSFPDNSINANAVFDLIHVDLWGPYRTTAFCGSRYFLTIVDDHSRAVWLYLLPDKTQVARHLRDFLALIERQFSKKVKSIRSDNGSEFMCLTRFFEEQGIVHETSCVHTPQQNGRVERKHRHILNVARALRFHANLPIDYWGECILTASYLINRTPSTLLQGATPFEKLYGNTPSYTHLRVFGCLAYAHNFDHKGDKFTSRSRRCIFLGYPYGKKGWKLYDLDREIFFVSRDVTFQKDVFPLSTSTSPLPPLNTGEVSSPLLAAPPDDDTDSLEITAAVTPAPVESEKTVESETALAKENPAVTENTGGVTATAAESLGQGKRPKIPNVRLHDYVVGTVSIAPPPPLSSQPSSGSHYPLSDYISCDMF